MKRSITGEARWQAPETGRACDTGPVTALEEAVDLVEAAERITVLTGAGISTDSGIPDFRGPNGVWTKNPGAERTSNLADYLGDPAVRRQAWQNRLNHPSWRAEPNAGHRALVDLAAQGRLVALLTQNIDELHQRAGNDPAAVVELHGSMHQAVCWSCGDRHPMAQDLERVAAGDPNPACSMCGGILKSATISFGQALDPGVLARAEAASLDCQVFVAVGTTLSVHPAAGYAPLAKRHGAALVIVNAQPTAYDATADVVVRGSISEVLPRLVARPAPAPGRDPAPSTSGPGG
jgi:NAD-dependent deacetylase